MKTLTMLHNKKSALPRWLLLGLVMLMPWHESQAAEAGVQYTLTRQYATVLFRVEYQNQATLIGRFDDFEATLLLDPDNLENSRLEASVNMASLNVADADLIEMLVYSSTWFNTNVFPRSTFTTRSVEVKGPAEADFIGELNFMGVTQPWTLNIRFKGELGGSTVGIAAMGGFKRSDYGLNQYMNVAADDIQIEVHARFNRN